MIDFSSSTQEHLLGDNAMAVMIAHARDPVTPPRELNPSVPEDLARVVLKCLANNPDDRYLDTPILAEALNACGDAPNWSPRHALDWWQSHRNAAATQTAAAQTNASANLVDQVEVSFQPVEALRIM